ncbi:uncharacterized protein YfkK (UPF0435 family) [Scopulibacillus darangshiensis]|uniref:UPF0435 protein EV207_11274 n=1 Tax=Scopulibacillus darangshiensis TaxID=442528 RepID=A0A4R2P320_9BACL|nr:DUF1128 domain-containing protein [Scopulibacillus darangshiensis]TCP29149.1 uncharacterized protein YfkK (UPF0435 family) [Scopulibacillus darangshiensis]
MDLTVKSNENIEYMLDVIKKKLQLVNQDVLKPDAFSTEFYEELHDIYQLVQKQSTFSIREMEAILDELKTIRQTTA